MTMNALDVNPRDVDPREIKALERFKKDVLYIEANRQRWLEEFSDCWVVVYGERLIGHADDFHHALAIARDKGLEANDVAVELITVEPRTMIL